MDIYGMLGIDVTAQTQKETKKAEKKQERKGSSTNKKVVGSNYTLPVTVVSGWYEPFTIVPEMADGEESVSEQRLLEIVGENLAMFQVGQKKILLEKVGEKLFISLSPDAVVAKGELYLLGETTAIMANETLDLSSVYDGGVESVKIDALSDALASTCPIFKGCGFVQEDSKIIPVFQQEELKDGDLKPDNFPLNMVLFGRKTIQVQWTAYCEKCQCSDEDLKLDMQALKKLVLSEFPDLDGNHIRILYDKECQIFLIVPYVKEKKVVSSGKKEELWNVDGTQLSLIFTRLPLTPELFKGKKEVTSKELKKYLETTYPEYSGDNVSFHYNKDKSMIIPTLIGSRKGGFVGWM